jgi:hypothetical protein
MTTGSRKMAEIISRPFEFAGFNGGILLELRW